MRIDWRSGALGSFVLSLPECRSVRVMLRFSKRYISRVALRLSALRSACQLLFWVVFLAHGATSEQVTDRHTRIVRETACATGLTCRCRL